MAISNTVRAWFGPRQRGGRSGGGGLGRIAVALVAASTLIPWTAASANLVSTFDSGAEGWGVLGAYSVYPDWVSTGGNPGGYIKLTDYWGVPDLQATAPAAFLGDRSEYLGGVFSFDAKLFAWGTGYENAVFGTVVIQNGSQQAVRDLASGPPVFDHWTTYSAPLTAAGWSGDDLASVLGNVTGISVTAECYQEVEVVGLDNIGMKSSPSVPEPASLCLLGLACGGIGAMLKRRRRQ